MADQRNLLLAIVLSILVIIGFNVFYVGPTLEEQEQPVSQERTQDDDTGDPIAVPGGDTVPADPPDRSEVLTTLGERIDVATPRMTGSLSTVGGRLDDLTLRDYYETTERETPVDLLSPAGANRPYYAEFGWVPGGNTPVTVPDRETEWQVEGGPLAPGSPVTFTWDNGEGVTFERRVEVDDDYLFTITQSIENNTDETLSLFPFGLISRHYTPPTSRLFILHEGPIGAFDESLDEMSYSDLRDDGPIERESTGGWMGISDKYWLVSLIPDQSEAVQTRYLHSERQGQDRYQVDFRGEGKSVTAGDRIEHTSRLYAGAKEVRVLDRYREDHDIALFDRAVDFGWLYFMTKPFFYALDFLGRTLGNFGLGIIAFTVILRILLFPLANKAFRAMSRMKKLQPQMMELRDRYQDDRQRMQQELMELYKREKVNPLSGCLPILVQIPIFFALYKVLYVTIEMRHAPFYGWIDDLSARDPTSLFNLFGLLPYDVPAFLTIGAWPLIMGFTMWLQQKLNPAPTDPMQARILMALPFVFTVVLASFPAGLVIYWASNNALSIAQQWVIMKREGVANPASNSA